MKSPGDEDSFAPLISFDQFYHHRRHGVAGGKKRLDPRLRSRSSLPSEQGEVSTQLATAVGCGT